MNGYQLVCRLCGLTSPRARTPAQARLLAEQERWQRGHFRKQGQPTSGPIDLCPECIALSEQVKAK